MQLGTDVIDVPAGAAVRVAPGTVRSVWNEREGDAELLMVSTRIDDVGEDVELVKDFWPA